MRFYIYDPNLLEGEWKHHVFVGSGSKYRLEHVLCMDRGGDQRQTHSSHGKCVCFPAMFVLLQAELGIS